MRLLACRPYRYGQLAVQLEAGRRTHALADGWCYKTYAYNLEDPFALQTSGWTPLDITHVLSLTNNKSLQVSVLLLVLLSAYGLS